MSESESFAVTLARDAVRSLVRSEAGHIAYLDDELNALIEAVRSETKAVAEARLHALTRSLERSVAQLRHAYQQLTGGHVHDPNAFADGLLAPEIRRLEEALKEAAREETMGTPERVVPQPTTAVQSTDQPVEEPFGIWQPIATAPKDADVLLLFRDGWGVQPGYWDDLADEPAPKWVSCETHGLTGGGMGDGPTHWMPLPSPPRVLGESR